MESDEEDPPVSKNDQPEDDSLNEDDIEGASDPELEDLLDMSLGEFGKHVVPPKDPSPPPKSKLPPNKEAEFNQVFGEAQAAESQLNEAMKMMQSENPDLWKQFEDFSKSLGMPEGIATNMGGVSSHGESSVDTEGASTGERKGSLTGMLDETLARLKQNAQDIEGGGGDPFSLDSDESEDQLLKMMQGMMSSLLSRDVLYPSLMELCKQYPDWLTEHKSEITQEDYQRYSKQLEIMTTICRAFESQPGQAEPSDESSERVLSLMQQLQQYGQPPAELAAESEGAGLFPPGVDMQNPQNCTVM